MMTVLGADLPAVLLILLSVGATLNAWNLQIRRDRYARRALAWFRGAHPERWDELSWSLRRLLPPMAALQSIERRWSPSEPAWREPRTKASRWDRALRWWLFGGIAAIALVIAGVELLGWSLG